MCSLSRKIAVLLFSGACALPALAGEFGRPATPEEIKLWDIDIRPDGKGLPQGSGTVERGRAVYAQSCASCHGAGGEGGFGDRLVGGQGSLASDRPLKTIGSYWPYATTLLDYVRRAMPYQAPGSLTVDDDYAVAAYLLELNGIHPPGGALNQDSIVQIQMPNRFGFVPDREFRDFLLAPERDGGKARRPVRPPLQSPAPAR
jgi:mono/diheme cytochrome c family protein